MINLALEVDHELRTNVIQALKRDNDLYGEFKLHKLKYFICFNC